MRRSYTRGRCAARWAFAEASRYNGAVRHVIAFVAALVVGCASPPAPKQPTVGPVGTAKPTGATRPAPAGPVAAPTAAPVLPTIGCPSPTCAYHAGGGGYFTCLASGAGACFHFGAACTPPEACMYDPGDRTYKRCTQASEGTCQQWGTGCAPATRCMLDATDGLHRQCDEVAGGSCKRYGALCAP